MRTTAHFVSRYLLFVVAVIGGLSGTNSAIAQNLKALHAFGNTSGDGSNPYAGLTMDKAGNLYGTTQSGGAFGAGTVYRLMPDGTETVLYSFTGGTDGAMPLAGLLIDEAGNLYGTTWFGGANTCGPRYCGTVFRIAPDGTETVLHSFAGGSDGASPTASLVADKAGNLYGSTSAGGNTHCGGSGCGTVFKLAPDGTEAVLYAFKGRREDGHFPFSGLVMDKSGNLYGTTQNGGAQCPDGGCGTVFRIAPDGKETLLHVFSGSDGRYPFKLVGDGNGNLYGTTNLGGDGNCAKYNVHTHGCGTVFRLTEAGSFSLLHSFVGTDGFLPIGLYVDTSGNLFGTAADGGASKMGTVFEVMPDGTTKVLHSFHGDADGSDPTGGVIADKKGNLFGTTDEGGDIGCNQNGTGCGTVFKLKY